MIIIHINCIDEHSYNIWGGLLLINQAQNVLSPPRCIKCFFGCNSMAQLHQREQFSWEIWNPRECSTRGSWLPKREQSEPKSKPHVSQIDYQLMQLYILMCTISYEPFSVILVVCLPLEANTMTKMVDVDLWDKRKHSKAHSYLTWYTPAIPKFWDFFAQLDTWI